MTDRSKIRGYPNADVRKDRSNVQQLMSITEFGSYGGRGIRDIEPKKFTVDV
jgi:hypothetical protein